MIRNYIQKNTKPTNVMNVICSLWSPSWMSYVSFNSLFCNSVLFVGTCCSAKLTSYSFANFLGTPRFTRYSVHQGLSKVVVSAMFGCDWLIPDDDWCRLWYKFQEQSIFITFITKAKVAWPYSSHLKNKDHISEEQSRILVNKKYIH